LAYVEVNSGESFESALRRFKRKVQQEAIIKEIKRHTVYLKPGERKRLKVAQAQKRMRKRMRREFSEL
jgi:small subunit ribosomal protein S21